MQTVARSALVLCAFVCASSVVAAQTPVGALAIDERQGDQYGWAVDYEMAAAARAAALSECGAGCSVVLTFNRCAAYAADQDADSTAVGWAESYGSAAAAQQAALSACNSRGGTACIVRVWGCNAPVVEEGLGLDVALRQRIQRGLRVAGFDPGGADGLFGPRTRAAIRGWQSSRGAQATGYLDAAAAAALRSVAAGPAVAAAAPPAVQPPVATAEQETVFWQSIANSTDPADFEAYLAQFPNGVFRMLAQNRLAALGASGGAAARSGVGDVGVTEPGSRPAGTAGDSGARLEADVDARGRPDPAFRPGQTCTGQPAGTPCWMEISGRLGCYVWNPSPQPGETVTWTGECSGGVVHGTGVLTWASDGGEQVNTGRFQDGKANGHLVVHFANGDVWEGPVIDYEQNDHWVIRRANGRVEEGAFVDGERHGDWVFRNPNGDTSVRRFENGQFVEVVER